MDYEHIKTLLEVVKLSMGYPKLKLIHDKAMGELEKVDADIQKEIDAAAKKKAPSVPPPVPAPATERKYG